MHLRDYQLEGEERIREALRRGARSVLATAPTGSGKTVLFAHIAAQAAAKYKHVLVVAHRREIIHQTSEKLAAYDCPHGIIMAGHARLNERVQVASIQTLVSRYLRTGREPPPANLLIIDEAHHSVSPSYRKVRELFEGAVLLGLTATPVRGDGRGLGSLYDELIEVATVEELMERGFLVPARVHAPSIPDLSGVAVRRGDYVEADLERVMDRNALVGDVVRDWRERAADRPTIVFAVSVAHSRHLCEEFRAAGVRAAHIDGTTDHEIRDETLRAFARGDLSVLCNCQVLTEGWDCPSASCAVLARPTKSYGLYLQMVGRVLRPAEGKADALVIDHAGAVYEHGFPEDAGDWSLDPDEPIAARRRERLAQERQPTTCRQCWHVYRGRRDCPKCGWQPTPRMERVSFEEGRLIEVPRRRVSSLSPEEKAWNACLYRAANSKRRLTVRQAGAMYFRQFGRWPRDFLRMPLREEDWGMQACEFVQSRAWEEAAA